MARRRIGFGLVPVGYGTGKHPASPTQSHGLLEAQGGGVGGDGVPAQRDDLPQRFAISGEIVGQTVRGRVDRVGLLNLRIEIGESAFN